MTLTQHQPSKKIRLNHGLAEVRALRNMILHYKAQTQHKADGAADDQQALTKLRAAMQKVNSILQVLESKLRLGRDSIQYYLTPEDAQVLYLILQDIAAMTNDDDNLAVILKVSDRIEKQLSYTPDPDALA